MGEEARRGALASRGKRIVSSLGFHVAVVVFGTLFVLMGACHGGTWFDESYSVALASHSFSEIARIGAGDVHPVLFYEALHVVYLLFGQNLIAYRVFTAAGVVLLALIGAVFLRRDFGWRCGLVFSVFALFMPYLSYIGVEIRMYSWAAFAVTFCALAAWHIVRDAREGEQGASRSKRLNGLCGWWIGWFVSSLAAAYLHYFAAMTAFLINLLFLAYLARAVRKAALERAQKSGDVSRETAASTLHAKDSESFVRARRRLFAAVGAMAVQVLLYAPWLSVVAEQASVVSCGYWASFTFPGTLIEWFAYPLMTSQIVFAMGPENYGFAATAAVWACEALAIAGVALWALTAVARCGIGGHRVSAALSRVLGRRFSTALRSANAEADRSGAAEADQRATSSSAVRAAWCAVAVYGGLIALSLVLSALIGSLILYYRYLSVAVGLLAFALAVAFTRIRPRAARSMLLAAFLGVAVLSQVLFLGDAYDPRNEAPFSCVQELVGEAGAAQGGGEVPILSSDIGAAGPLVVDDPEISVSYLDWQEGNWALSYEAYAPALASYGTWDEALAAHRGPFVVIGQTSDGSMPSDIADLAGRGGATLQEIKTFYRPYERTWFTVALMECN